MTSGERSADASSAGERPPDGRPAPGRRPTIRDVARAAGVSLTTVSDAVNRKGRVDPRTRRRVLQAAADVGWQPKRSARALRSGRTGIIALCLPRGAGRSGSWLMSHDYYMELAAACAATAMDSERLLLLTPRPRRVEELAHLDVDGMIVVDPSEGDPILRTLDEAGVPVVTVDRDLASASTWWVGADNRSSATMLLDHLRERGARRIALFTSSERWAWFEDVGSAYAQWCEAHGVAPLVRDLDLDEPAASAAVAITELLDAADRPDAVLALPYGSALGVIGGARQRGLSVPGDLRVASGVDSHALETFAPPVTAVDLRPVEVARAAVELLSRRIEGAAGGGPIVREVALRVRGST
jgi:DNA-binding LacI/PurR family transcriptional regulator